MPMSRILIVEDQERLAQFLVRGLKECSYTVSWVGTCKDALDAVAAQSDPNNRRRYLFDYKKANEDLNTMRAGIGRYTQPSRAQPLDYGKVSGDYTRDRPLWR